VHRRAAYILLLALVYFAAAKLSLFAAIPPGYATAIWPPSGIALAALLLGGPALWPGVWIGSFLANAAVDGALVTPAVIATGSALQAFVVATVMARRIGVPRQFVGVRQVITFVGLATCGAVIAPTVALVALAALFPLEVQDLAMNWWTWWQGDACGMLIFAPLVLTWTAPGIRWTARRTLEGLAFALLLVVASNIVFTAGLARTFVFMPFIIWAAFRFGQREVTSACAVICGVALWYTLRTEVGPFAELPRNEMLLLLLAFVSTVVVTGLMLCAVLAQLRAARGELERSVRERTLAESEQRLRLMLESVVDYAIFMLDRDGRIATWNAGAQRIKGYSAEEIIGEHFSRFYPRDDVAAGKPVHALGTAAREGRYEEEGWRVRKDGSAFWASVVISAVRDDKGRPLGFAKVTRDLTERKRTEAELVRAKVEAEKASESKSQFLANMSHELRTPLNSLLILARLLSDNSGKNLNDKQVRFAQTIYASGTDLLALINDLLDLAKIESGAVTALHMGATPLTDLRDELERTFGEVAREKKLEFRIGIAPDLPETVRTDATRLKQILKNLLANAFKFTREGAVELRMQAREPASIAFSVSDTGIGIPKDKQQIIFEAFQQADGSTSRQYGGTGLGLSISRELARLLGGRLELESEPGRGSTFTLVLPLADERAAAELPELRAGAL
jgi:PAS domain S-box-containing protein